MQKIVASGTGTVFKFAVMPDLPPIKIPTGVSPHSTQTPPVDLQSAKLPGSPAPVNLYQFYLDKCVITNTRSIHQDTLIAGLGLIVTKGTQVSEPFVASNQVGDHDNTTFEFWQQGLAAIDHIGIEPGATFTFLYEIYNNGAKGHPKAYELEQLIADHLKL